MDDAFKKQAEEWYERGRHDIETAQLLYDEHGYTDTIAYHIQQALEKYLKGFLVLHGIKPPKIHELDTLLNQAAAFDKGLIEYLELSEKASRFYIEDRYPLSGVVRKGIAFLYRRSLSAGSACGV